MDSNVRSGDQLPDAVAGVRIADGVARVSGDRALYCQLLAEFELTRANAIREMRAALEAGKPELVATLAHTIAGVAANLSATTLSTAAVALESAVPSSPSGAADSHLARMEVAMTEVLSSIRELHLEDRQAMATEPVHRAPDGPAQLEAQLRELSQMLGRRELAAVRLFETIRPASQLDAQAQALALLETQLNALNFTAAVTTVESMMKSLKFGRNQV